MADCYNNVGIIFASQEDYRQAISYSRIALRLMNSYEN
jgi:hypothetical protein